MIPNPEYISDRINGAVYTFANTTILTIGTLPDDQATLLANILPLISGSFIVRYGLTLLMPAGDVMIPGLLSAEKGGMLLGRAAWDYLQSYFQVHPRADVVGISVNGQKRQVYVREIDFGEPIHVLIYADMEATMPIAEVTGVMLGQTDDPLPDLLMSYLPSLNDLAVLINPE